MADLIGPLRAAGHGVVGAPRAAAGLVRDTALLPGRVVAGVAQALADVHTLAGGVAALHEEVVGMRGDVQGLDRSVWELRGEVGGLTADVGGIRGTTEQLDLKIGGVTSSLAAVSGSLASVEVLTNRLGRFGRARPARGELPAG